ncbi:hypothetical protein D3C84_1054820 [compost metagenome]
MPGNVRNDDPIVTDKVPGKAQPQIFVGAVAVQHQHAAGRLIRPALPGRDRHLVDRHDDFVQPIQLGFNGHAQVIQPITDGRIVQPAPGHDNRDNDNE